MKRDCNFIAFDWKFCQLVISYLLKYFLTKISMEFKQTKSSIDFYCRWMHSLYYFSVNEIFAFPLYLSLIFQDYLNILELSASTSYRVHSYKKPVCMCYDWLFVILAGVLRCLYEVYTRFLKDILEGLMSCNMVNPIPSYTLPPFTAKR